MIISIYEYESLQRAQNICPSGKYYKEKHLQLNENHNYIVSHLLFRLNLDTFTYKLQRETYVNVQRILLLKVEYNVWQIELCAGIKISSFYC